MVLLYPNNLDSIKYKIEDSEKEFYILCKNNLNDDWIVWHSVEWLGIDNLFSGETDFLLLNKKLGFLVIEVKGGGINIKNGIWRSIDRYGIEHKISNPFNQGRHSMFFFIDTYLLKALEQNNQRDLIIYNRKGKALFPGLVWYGVFFPDCFFKNQFKKQTKLLESDESFNMVFDKSDQQQQENGLKEDKESESPLEKFLLGIFNLVQQRKNLFHVRLPIQASEFFTSLISPEIKTEFKYDSLLFSYSQQIKEFERYEDDILDLVHFRENCLFKGSAGTGKTYIAMKKAISISEKNKILIICYNRELKDFIRQYINERTNNKNIDVYTIHSFLKKFLFGCLSQSKSKSLYSYLLKDEKEFSISFLNTFGNQPLQERFLYDAIIVDEAQDLNQNLWPIIQIFKKRKDTLFYIFFDGDQKKFNPDFTPEQFGMEKNDITVLKRNLRNCDKIVQWITSVTEKGEYNEYLVISGFNVEVTHLKSLKEAFMKIMSTIYVLNIDKNTPLEKIIVLCDKKLSYLEDLSFISKFTIKNENIEYFRIKYKKKNRNYSIVEPARNKDFIHISKNELDKENRYSVLFNGIGTFKGLESEIIFLLINRTEVNDMDEETKRNLYIGASRGKFLLYIFYYE